MVTRCRLELAPDALSVIFPTYHDVSEHLSAIEWWRGKTKDLDGSEAGGMTVTLDNDKRRFELGRYGDPTAIVASGNEITDDMRALGVAGDGRPFQDQERWGDFEAASAGAATGFDSLEAASAANQFTTVTTAALVEKGTKAGKFTVRPGDVVSGGERSEVLYTTGWGTGEVAGQTHYWSGSIRPEAPWQHTTEWEILHQVHADAPGFTNLGFGQPPMRIQVNSAKTHYEFRLVTGAFANSTDAGAGQNAGTDMRFDMLPFEGDVTVLYRYAVHWTTDDTGWVVAEMKRSTEVEWVRYVEQFGIQTLPTYPGQAAATSIYLKWGLYRHTTGGGDSFTNVVYHDGITGGHCWPDVEFVAPAVTADSSIGIYPGATNICPNGSFETNDTSWAGNGAGTTVDPTASEFYFGQQALIVTMPGSASSEGGQFAPTLTNGTTYTYLVRVKTAAVGQRYRVWAVDNASATLATQTRTGDGEWHWHVLRFTATANNTHKIRVGRTATGASQVLYIDGAMLVSGVVAQPYIHTDGGTASRSDPRVQITANGLDEEQGWFVAKVRMGWNATDAPSSVPYVFRWRDDDNNELYVRYDTTADKFAVNRKSAGVGGEVQGATQGWLRGEYVLVFGYWTATDTGVRVNMQPFTTAANTAIPTLAAAEFDLGSSGVGTNFLGGDVMWAAWGTGVLTDADADAIFLRDMDNPDPWQADLEELGVVTLWTATTNMIGGDPIDLWKRARVTLHDDDTGEVQQGIYYLHEPKLGWYGKSRANAVTFGYVDGEGLQANQNLPRLNPPDAVTLQDVIAFRRPAFYYVLDDESGNKAVHHTRQKRKRRKHESRRHYRRHGFRHWTTKATRSDAEGASGPAGTYKNTPLLGEPGLVPHSDETCVRFREAQSEYMRVPVDRSDTTGRALSVVALVKAVSLPGDWQVIAAGPATASSENSVWVFGLDSSGIPFLQLGATGEIEAGFGGATALSLNTTYLVVGSWDGDRVLMWSSPVADVPLTLHYDRGASGNLEDADDNEFLYVAAQKAITVAQFWDGWLQHVAVFERGLSEASATAIRDAALLRGYSQQTVGQRIAAIADGGAFWDGSRCQLGGPQVQPVYQFGQSPADEVDAATECEMPDSHYYFDGDGFPEYLSSTYRSAAPYDTVACFLSDDPDDWATGAVAYDDSLVDWDSELYNVVPASKDGGEELLATDELSRSLRLDHSFTGGTGLLLVEDDDVQHLANRVLQRFSGPPIVRPFSVMLHGVDDAQRPHIFQRDVGELVRFKRTGSDGQPIDVLCVILGWRKRYERGQVTCTWNLSRPVADLSDGAWHIGIEGFSEIGQTTILG